MRALPPDLRKQLENVVVAARRAAEGASRAAIDGLGVFTERRPEHLDADQASLRNGLRAKMRQLGGKRELLIAECAYEQWHRLLFARFLAENKLLLHPEFQAPITLADCEELSNELGEPDGWSVAARYAAEILPGIFHLDDPCVRLRLAPEGRHALEQFLDSLPRDVFLGDDALGWVYQFWQKEKKDEINASERKIGGTDLGPVTQLFTENYMVRFLLENSLGAWWAARHPDSPLVRGFQYLRLHDGRPAAGSFDGWPDQVTNVTVMDPCCGSGHFLVEAFNMLWRMRVEEEGLTPVEAQDAVLRDNLFGLEIDARCVQIAMFAVALQAWKAGGGWRQLPMPHIACSGMPVKAPIDELRVLAKGDQRLEKALIRLCILLRDADTLGSLTDPRAAELSDPRAFQWSLEDISWGDVLTLLEKVVTTEVADPATAVLGANAAGVARAVRYLSRTYTLVATNVPYLGRWRMTQQLKDALNALGSGGREDLAFGFVRRSMRLLEEGKTLGFLARSEWTFLRPYEAFRKQLLETSSLQMVCLLGDSAFCTPLQVKPAMAILTMGIAQEGSLMSIAKLEETGIAQYERALQTVQLDSLTQQSQLRNPDARILLEGLEDLPAIGDVATTATGLSAGDSACFDRYFWELGAPLHPLWEYLQGTARETSLFSGRQRVVLWENEQGAMAKLAESVKHLNHAAQNWRRGKPLWQRRGVAVSPMGSLPVTLYTGDRYDLNTLALVPKHEADLPALWAYCSSEEFLENVRLLDGAVKIAPRTLESVPFDVERWRRVAEARFPDGLPEPWSDDPTQWLFEGRPEVSTAPLQVAVARLLGYRWPEQAEADDLDEFVDGDGIVCLQSVAGEDPAASRLQRVLATSYGEGWSPSKEKQLLEQAGSKKKNLTDWLHDDFFKQHCALFGNRPFVWHIWDGRRDGFSALVSYHLLDRKMLEKLTFTYLGQDWVERQRAAAREEVTGAAARLTAALNLQQRLEAILKGENPYDVYVRWKALHEQPIGWEPDLKDGVRLNIRPFVQDGVLRSKFNIHWRKDRGKNRDGSERFNDVHFSLDEKRAARKQLGLT